MPVKLENGAASMSTSGVQATPHITAAEVSAALGGTRSGDGHVARCPAHDDSTPSLSIADGKDGRLLVHCHGGCTQNAVIEELRGRGLWRHSKSFSDAERRQMEKDVARQREEAHATAARRASDILERETIEATSEHPYLAAKKLPAHGLRVYTGDMSIAGMKCHGALVVRMEDAESGDTVSLQFIAADGEKRFLPGGRVEESCWSQRGAMPERTVIVGEGLASTLSAAEALASLEPVVYAAMSVNNLPAMARFAREWHPTARIIVAADNDLETEGNPGLAAADEAAKAGRACTVVPTVDYGDWTRACDWSDLLVSLGRDGTRGRIIAALFDAGPAPDNVIAGPWAEHEVRIERLIDAPLLQTPTTPCAPCESSRGALRKSKIKSNADEPGPEALMLSGKAPPSARRRAGERGRIDGAELLDEVRTFVARFVAFPEPTNLDAVTLWAAHAHMIGNFHTTPRLAMLSAEPESGKTRALEILDLLTPSAMLVFSPSVAAIFRKLAQEQITLLLDECDTIFTLRGKDDQNEDLRALLNAGYRRGASIPRCVGKNHEVKDFKVFAATALAGIGDLPDTVMTRAIVIRMKRRAAGEKIEPYRSRTHEAQGHALRDRLVTWAESVGAAAGSAWPELPDGVVDRRAEAWEPLIAIADLAGGEWPNRARVAAVADVAAHRRRDASLGIRLLADLRPLFGEREAVSTEEILKSLTAMDESPWADLKGKPLNARGLATRLKKYGIAPKTVRIGTDTPKGYTKEDLHDAWQRYLPTQALGAATSATSDTPAGSRAEMLGTTHGCDMPRGR